MTEEILSDFGMIKMGLMILMLLAIVSQLSLFLVLFYLVDILKTCGRNRHD